MHEVLEIVVNGPRKIHDMARVAVTDRGEDQNLFRHFTSGAPRDLGWANEIDIERQVVPMLFDGPARQDADLAEIDGVIDFGPGKFFVAVFLGSAGSHRF